MYKLVYYLAENYLAFLSNFGNKLEINLDKLYDKQILVIIGENGVGKTVFGGTVLPSTYPLLSNKKFIIPDKTGKLIKVYRAIDGTEIKLTTVHIPKNDTHSGKIFFSIKYPNTDTFMELNESGNISTCDVLINQYFGLNRYNIKNLIFNQAMMGLVNKTSMERIDHIVNMLKSANDIKSRYNMASESYKMVRNSYKICTDKLSKLNTTEQLKLELEEIDDSLITLLDMKEKYLKKVGHHEISLKGASDISVYIEKHEDLLIKRKELNREIDKLKNLLNKIEYTTGEQILDKVDKDLSILLNENANLEKDYKRISKEIDEYIKIVESLKNDINEISDEIVNTDELDEIIATYNNDIDELELSNVDMKKFEKMNYKEARELRSIIDSIFIEYDILIDNYGTSFLDFCSNGININKNNIIRELEKECYDLENSLNDIDDKVNDANEALMKLKKNIFLKERAEMRPKECVIDSCPFIQGIEKWNAIEIKINDIEDFIKKALEKHDIFSDRLSKKRTQIQLIRHTEPFFNKILNNIKKIEYYFNIDLPTVEKHISSAMLSNVFDINKIDKVCTILSKIDIYHNLKDKIKSTLKIKNELESRANLGTEKYLNRLKSQLNDYELKYEKQTNSAKELYSKINDNCEKIDQMKIIHELLEKKDVLKKELIDFEKLLHGIEDDISLTVEKINQLSSIKNNLKELYRNIKEIDERIEPLNKKRGLLKYQIVQRDELEIEQSEISHVMLIHEAVTMTSKPGKGLWKVLFEIYIGTIIERANVIMESLFNGELELVPYDPEKSEKLELPYVYKGVLGNDISEASSAQKTIIAVCLNLAMIEDYIPKSGIVVYDEVEKDLSKKRKNELIETFILRSGYLGISQYHMITHYPEFFNRPEVGYLVFPGVDYSEIDKKDRILVR